MTTPPDPAVAQPVASLSAMRARFPCLARFSRETGIPEENLLRAFEIEREFHARVLAEPDAAARKRLYREVYEAVHPLYGETAEVSPESSCAKDRFVRLFRWELEGMSVLDVGCGQGHFLFGVARLLRHGALVGIDTSAPVLPKDAGGVRFVHADIIDFDLGETFDVVFSDNVLEHVAPQDLPAHLASVRRALRGGRFIVLTPSRLFGPCDVTRIIDSSYTGRVPSQGTHLNESTYGELIATFRGAGFRDFRTVCPVPKVRFLLPRFRMRPDLLCWIERHRSALGAIHALKLRGRCVARLDVILICRAA